MGSMIGGIKDQNFLCLFLLPFELYLKMRAWGFCQLGFFFPLLLPFFLFFLNHFFFLGNIKILIRINFQEIVFDITIIVISYFINYI